MSPVKRGGGALSKAVASMLVVLAAGLGGCKGDTGNAGAPGAAAVAPTPPPSNTLLSPAQNLPGAVIKIVSVSGSPSGAFIDANGPQGAFQVGDVMSVKFTVKRNDGSNLPLTELDCAEPHFSGPSFNYQRVFAQSPQTTGGARKTELVALSTVNADGSYTYTFPPIPATYGVDPLGLAKIGPPNFHYLKGSPLVSTGSAQADVLVDQPLLSGTYTIGLVAYKFYTVGNQLVKDVANAHIDLPFGTATTVQGREVVTEQNCNQCHVNLGMHSQGLPGAGRRQDVKLCVTCHVAGAEDYHAEDNHAATGKKPLPPGTVPIFPGTIPGISPSGVGGQSVEFKVFIHQIHNGQHLPSSAGIGVDASGNVTYTAAPKILGFRSDELEDLEYQGLMFPAFPSHCVPMPQNRGYSSLSPGQQAQDDLVRGGVVACDMCHGTPTASIPDFGPDAVYRLKNYPAPKDGNLAYIQPSRRACGSCHDDIDWSKPYSHNNTTATADTTNGDTLRATSPMPPQPDDSKCMTCHAPKGTLNADGSRADLFPVKEAHLHPVGNPAVNPGLDFSLTSLSGSVSGADTINPGETVQITFNIKDDSGAAVSASALASIDVVISGPDWNRNLVLFTSITPTSLAGTGPYTVTLQQRGANFVVPATYPEAINGTTAFGETAGKWTGKALVSGRYAVGIWGYRQLAVTRQFPPTGAFRGASTETTLYAAVSPPAIRTVSVTNGVAGPTPDHFWPSISPVITSNANCNACHSDLVFHDMFMFSGGFNPLAPPSRGFDTCILCHGTAGPQDVPSPVTGVAIEFRNMLHKIHDGHFLSNQSYQVMADNGQPDMFGDIIFPAMAEGVKHCQKCHGGADTGLDAQVFDVPADRSHPTQQGAPMRRYAATCLSCHDSNDVAAHAAQMTNAGQETCATCHGQAGAPAFTGATHKTHP